MGLVLYCIFPINIFLQIKKVKIMLNIVNPVTTMRYLRKWNKKMEVSKYKEMLKLIKINTLIYLKEIIIL